MSNSVGGISSRPRSTPRRRNIAASLLAAGIVLAAGFSLRCGPREAVLELSSTDSGEVRWCSAVRPEEEFTLSFIHSVNKRPVFDTLRAQGDHIVIVRSRFDAFGAGMPEATTEQGTFRVLEDGRLEWTVNRPVPEIVVRVGRVAQHTLTFRGRDIRLAELSAPGSALTLRVRPVSPLHRSKGRCSGE